MTVPLSLVNKGFKIRVGAAEADASNKDFHRRMDRVSALFAIKSATTFVANPLGGGIYIQVPYKADFGSVLIQVSGAVEKAPFFCTLLQR